MTNDTAQKLAASLTAESTELIPFLPYLLQDFNELGSSPAVMIDLLERHAAFGRQIAAPAKVLDLACGKGTVSVAVAAKFQVKVKGVDLLPDFLEASAKLAAKRSVADLCEFAFADVNEAVQTERGYDCVIFGAAGNILGNPAEMLAKLKTVIKPGGLILIDEGFLPDGGSQADVCYDNYELLTESKWHELFAEAGLELLETVPDSEKNENADTAMGMAYITTRANELIKKHPDKRELFEGYIQSQQNEYDDIDNNITCVTWILRKYGNLPPG